MREALAATEDGVLISLSVTPGSTIEKIDFDPWSKRIRLWVKALPADGKANAAVCAYLSRLLAADVTLVSGQTSRKKTALAHGQTIDGLPPRIEEAINKAKRP